MADSKPQDDIALKCECKAEDIIFLPCSGGSNCGQIANRVAVNLESKKLDTFTVWLALRRTSMGWWNLLEEQKGSWLWIVARLPVQRRQLNTPG